MVLSSLFRLYIDNFIRLTAVGGAGMAVVAVPMLIIAWFQDPDPAKSPFIDNYGADGMPVYDLQYSALFVALTLLMTVMIFVVYGALIAEIDAIQTGQPRATIGARYRVGIARLGPMVWTLVVAFIPLMLGAVLCYIPAIWLGTMWCLMLPVVVTERISGVKALRRSWQLVRGNFWIAFALLIVTYLISMSAMMVTYLPLAVVRLAIGANHLVAIPLSLIQIGLTVVGLPIFLILLVLLHRGLSADPDVVSTPAALPAAQSPPPQPPPVQE